MSESKEQLKSEGMDIEPSLSQETTLLNEVKTPASSAPNSVAANAALTSNENSQMKKAANLSDVKKILDSNRAGGNDIIVSLSTGAVVENDISRNRQRTKRNRNNRNRSVNPHDRVKESTQSGTPSKRGREQGGTPPGAIQPNKKLNNKKKETKNQASSSVVQNTTAETGLKVNTPAPPATQQSKLSGSGVLTGNLTQSTASSTSSDAGQVKPTIQGEKTEDDEGETPESYALVVKTICVAIIDQNLPGQLRLLDQNRFDILNSILTDTMLSQVGKNINPPEMEETRLISGVMRIRCANAETRKWLEQYVPLFDKKKLWNGAKLVVMDFKDIPKPYKFNLWVQGVKKRPSEIFTLLEFQNKGKITTTSWTVLHNEIKREGTAMTIGVGQDSFEILRNSSNSLFCGTGKAIFTLVKSCKENKTMLQNTLSAARCEPLKAPSKPAPKGTTPSSDPPAVST